MKPLFLFLIPSLWLSCSQKPAQKMMPKLSKIVAKPCKCDQTIATDTVFYATKPRVEISGNSQKLQLHCADMEVGIASVLDGKTKKSVLHQHV